MMKRYSLLFAVLVFGSPAIAKKVKFSVDMSNEIVNTTGIHVFGDFQVAAGFQFDWDPGATTMTQDSGNPNIYNVVIDVPAFTAYRYRFINGDQSYETEFVPEESRVNGAFDDNRWIYVDSLADDTTFVGTIPYSTNAPAGLSLVVFKVNMLNETVSPQGVHIGASFQGWNPATSTMFSFNDTVYRYQAFIPNGTYQYKFVNGNTANDFEYVWGSCAVNGSREVTVTGDIVLDPVNFSSCIVGLVENVFASAVKMFPNPSADFTELETDYPGSLHSVTVSDLSGRLVRHFENIGSRLRIEDLEAGMYMVSVFSNDKQQATLPLVIH